MADDTTERCIYRGCSRSEYFPHQLHVLFTCPHSQSRQFHTAALYPAKECISITMLNLHKKPLKMLLDKLEDFKYILPDSLAA